MAMAAGQYRVDAANLHERIIAVVPLIGAETAADPKRPMFAPRAGEAARGDGILAWGWVAGDDGRTAIVELVARDAAAFAEITASTDPRVKFFRKGRADASAMLLELQNVKRDFRPEALRVRVH
jgi:hypothetical protein